MSRLPRRLGRHHGLAILPAMCLAVLLSWPAGALETDQYLAWKRPLKDSTAELNAWFNLRLERVVRDANRQERPPGCWRITVAMERSLRDMVVIHEPDTWVENSPLVDRIPRAAGEKLDFWNRSIYGGSPPLTPARLMPLASTIEAGGVRFGADKLAHFVSVGWQYYKDFHRLLGKGVPPAEAINRVIRFGIDEELLYLVGYRVSGVFSIPDLEADYEGMLFYRDLCGGPDPVLALEHGRWVIRHPIDLGRYITPEWDESYEPLLISPSRWKYIRPRLKRMCPDLDDPWLENLWNRYERRDVLTPTERAILRLVGEGRIKDPRQFTLPAVCGRKLRPYGFVADAGTSPPVEPVPPPIARQVARDENEVRGKTLWSWSAGWQEPVGPAGSLGLLRTNLPAHSDCHLYCFMNGPFARLTAGPGGGEFSLGWATLSARAGRSGRSLDATWLGFSVRGAILRTWRPYSTWRADRTYAGIEFEASIARFSFTFGAMRRIAGGPDDHWLATWGVAWGF